MSDLDLDFDEELDVLEPAPPINPVLLVVGILLLVMLVWSAAWFV